MSASDYQQIILSGDLQLLFGKSGHRDRNAVMIFIDQLNVIGWITAIALALTCLQRVKQTVKPNSGTVKR
ncbi:hypothetical protein D3C87_1668710 [compost metagenome]